MKSVMKKALFVVGLVIALGTMARADTVVDFESYQLGGIADQDGWAAPFGDGQVINTDASQGVQSLAPISGNYGVSRILNDTYAVGQTSYYKVDEKGATGYMSIFQGTNLATGRAFEFGFNGPGEGFYAYGGATGGYVNQPTSVPDTNRWVTIWAKVYDAGSGNVKADIGWCELNQTPFVDGLKIAAYDSKDFAIGTIALNVGGFDRLSVSNAVPEPGTLTLLTAGLVSLLAYACRKRR